MRFNVIGGTRYFAASKRVLLGAVASSLVVAQVWAQSAPTGCGLNGQFTTTGTNTATGTGTAAGNSIAAVETSTAQVMELVAQRRAQEAGACPANFLRVG